MRRVAAWSFFVLAAPLAAQSPDWPAYGRDRGGERYSPLTGIDRRNVQRLAVAWEYSTGEVARAGDGSSHSAAWTPLRPLQRAAPTSAAHRDRGRAGLAAGGDGGRFGRSDRVVALALKPAT